MISGYILESRRKQGRFSRNGARVASCLPVVFSRPRRDVDSSRDFARFASSNRKYVRFVPPAIVGLLHRSRSGEADDDELTTIPRGASAARQNTRPPNAGASDSAEGAYD